MNNRLYVGNLSFHTTEDVLMRTFAQAGEVTEAKLVIDRETGRSRGFAFVSMGSDSDAQKAIMAGNRAALATYGGTTMDDPTLLGRLPAIAVPTLVVWGAADRIIPPAHGHAYADAIPGARLEIIPDAGHLPQLETPKRLLDLITG